MSFFPLTTKNSNGVSINKIHCVTRYDDDPLIHLLTQQVFIPTRGNNIIDVLGANICIIMYRLVLVATRHIVRILWFLIVSDR